MEQQGTEQITVSMFVPADMWEAFKAAVDLAGGHSLDDDAAYQEEWKRLSYNAISGFIKYYRGDVDPAVIV